MDEQQKKSAVFWPVVFILVLMILALGAGLFLVFQKQGKIEKDISENNKMMSEEMIQLGDKIDALKEKQDAASASQQDQASAEIIEDSSEPAVQEDKYEGWLTFRDTEYDFELKYPSKFKTIDDNYGWPNAIIHFKNKNGGQAYDGQIEAWDEELGFEDKYNKKPPFRIEEKDSGKYITINYYAYTDEEKADWQMMLDSFEFID